MLVLTFTDISCTAAWRAAKLAFHPAVTGVAFVGIERHPLPTKIPTVDCPTTKPFYYRNNFDVIRGREFWDDGSLKFTSVSFSDPVMKKGARDARTRVGPSFNHSGIVYGDTNHNLNLALTRQTANRFIVEPSDGTLFSQMDKIKMELLEYIYERNQRINIWKINFNVDDFHPEEYQWRELAHQHYADPHQKREPRIRGYHDIHDEGILFKTIWRNRKGFRLKLKRLEYAKPGKYGRTIGDFGVMASLQGAFFVDQCKKYLASRDFQFCSGRKCRYVKSPTEADLISVFTNINDVNSDVCFFAHSDDGIYRTKKGRIYNLDISKCDGSHGPHVYALLSKLFPGGGDCIRTLTEQLLEPVSIYSEPDFITRKCQRVVIKAKQPILYSGSTLTTLINTVAMFCIFDALERHSAETPEEILEAAASIGYILGDPVECIAIGDQQFLKNSPAIHRGQIVSIFNVGPLLRTFGTVKHDIVGKLNFEKMRVAGRQYNYGLVQGMFPDYDVPLLNKLKAMSYTISPVSKLVKMNIAASLPYTATTRGSKMSDELFLSRYSPTSDEILQLHKHLDMASDFDVIHDDLVKRILKMDYGL